MKITERVHVVGSGRVGFNLFCCRSVRRSDSRRRGDAPVAGAPRGARENCADERGKLAGAHFAQGWFALHLLLAILGECFFMIAAVSSLTYLFVVRRLKKKNRLRAVFFFPPLARLDDLTFKLIVSGTAVFAVGLLAGLYGNLKHFEAFSPGGKHIFALFLLLFYLALIVARRPFKLAGNRLAVLAVTGFALSIGLVVLPDNELHWKPLQPTVQEAAK